MSKGRFGVHGGQYIPETLMNAVIELEEAYNHYKDDSDFQAELHQLLNEYAGRPSRLYYAKHMTEDLGGAKVYLKREDLNHTGAHKINNVIGQCLLAKRMGKTRVIAETGAGQHGVATATIAALMGLECEIYMGKEDTIRQALNVYRMKLLGAKVHAVSSGTGTLKDAVSEAFRNWTTRIDDTHYVLGSVMGPHPFPTIVRDFQAVISKEIKEQILEKEGIMLVISNNRRKSLLKSKIILNIDFPTELINKYQIYEEAIIVNLKGNVKIEKKRFNGININDYEICFKYEDEFDFEKKEKYNKKDIYEAKIIKKQPYKFIMKRIDEDQVKIIELVGNKSTI